jgi:hypothetical protein
MNGQLHILANLPLGKKKPGIHWIGGEVGPRTGLEGEKRKFLILLGLKL